MDVLSDEESIYLIELVSQHPPLYDPNCKDRSVRDDIWLHIAQQMNTTIGDCKKQWKTIRDGYNRFKRRTKHLPGPVVPRNKRTKWKIYRLLSFLDNVPQEEPATGIDESSLESESPQCPEEFESHDIKQETVTTFVEIPVSPLDDDTEQLESRKRPHSERDDVLAYIKERENLQDSLLKNICHSNSDEYNSFANHVRHVLKKLSPLHKIKAKQEIFEVLTKYQIMAVDSSANSSSSS